MSVDGLRLLFRSMAWGSLCPEESVMRSVEITHTHTHTHTHRVVFTTQHANVPRVRSVGYGGMEVWRYCGVGSLGRACRITQYAAVRFSPQTLAGVVTSEPTEPMEEEDNIPVLELGDWLPGEPGNDVLVA